MKPQKDPRGAFGDKRAPQAKADDRERIEIAKEILNGQFSRRRFEKDPREKGDDERASKPI